MDFRTNPVTPLTLWGADRHRLRANTSTIGATNSIYSQFSLDLTESFLRQSSVLNANIAFTKADRTYLGYQGRLGREGVSPWVWRYYTHTMVHIQKASEVARSGPVPLHICGSSPPMLCLVHQKVSSACHLPT